MRKSYSIVFGALALYAAVSCQQEIDMPEGAYTPEVNGMTITASVGTETKTSLGENGVSTFWSADDKISVFDSNKEGNNRAFEIVAAGVEFPTKKATFVCTEEFTMPQDGQTDPLVVALYPYQEDAYCDFFYYDRNYITGLTLPVEQVAEKSGFDSNATFALALGRLSTKDELHFKNLYSLLKITFAEEGAKKVKVTVPEGEYIAGAAKVQLALDIENRVFTGAALSAVAEGGSNTVTLVSEEEFEAGTPYYLAVAPGTYSSITVSVDDVVVLETSEFVLAANTVYSVNDLENPVEVSDTDELNVAVAEGGHVVLASDITLSEILVLEKDLVLDLNGHTLSYATDVAGEPMITNQASLTINDSGNSGKIQFTYTGVPTTAKAANVFANKGVLVVNGGEITNTGSGNQIGYAIDNYGGSSLTVNGGKITATGSSYYDAVRLFCGSDQITVTVNDGQVSSIWAQNPSNNKASEVNGTVVINGGTVNATYFENYTTVKVKNGVQAIVTPYGAGSDNTTSEVVEDYTIYRFMDPVAVVLKDSKPIYCCYIIDGKALCA